MASDNGLSSTLAAFDRVRAAARVAAQETLQKSADELASGMRAMVPVDSGDLKKSIAVTPPGQSTPPHSQPGGSRVAGDAEFIVTAGNSDVRYPHHVEYGTVKTEASPYFWPIYWLLRNRIRTRTNRDIKKAMRDAWKGKR